MPNDMSAARTTGRAPAGTATARTAVGFTLMDLVAALAIAALLACLAIPSYRAQLLRAHRAHARAALLALATAEENFHLECNTYTAVLDDSRESTCSPPSLGFPVSAGEREYSIAVTFADAADWTATATAAAGSRQEMDERCRVFRLDGTGSRGASRADGVANDEECWRR
jgi:type IV pilus assembly protein PilE